MKVYDAQKDSLSVLPEKVRLYVCGMTVYGDCHIGHARVMVFFDAWVHAMRAMSHEVMYVRNITDIDDKIIHRANTEGVTWQEVAERYTQRMHDDELALGLNAPDMEPLATVHIPHMIKMIQVLIEKGHAYEANGSVFYKVASFEKYGRLSGQTIKNMPVLEETYGKQDALDFALWKAVKPEEPSWESPWGEGRPGWHIECSAMSTHVLGNTLDVHGGGVDLKFPHHENEIAQSEACYGCDFVRHWMHVGHVTIKSEKMSKSIGNTISIQAMLDQYPAEVVRYMLLSTHYRHPLNYDTPSAHQAWRSLIRIYTALARATSFGDFMQDAYALFCADLREDFNVPKAMSHVFEWVRALNKANAEDVNRWAGTIRKALGVLRLGAMDPEVFLKLGVDAHAVEALIQEREEARLAKDFRRADALRDQLFAMNVELKDGAEGVSWQRRCDSEVKGS